MVELEFKDSRVVAQSEFNLKPGEVKLARVEDLSPQIILRLIPEETPAVAKLFSLIKSYLPGQTPWGKLLEELPAILENNPHLEKKTINLIKAVLLDLIFGEKDLGRDDYFKNFITNSGLNYEAMLKKLLLNNFSRDKLNSFFSNNLKGLLLKIQGELGETGVSTELWAKSDKTAVEVFKPFELLIKNIEHNQLVNYLRNQEDESLLFQIPLNLKNEIKTLKLYFYDNKGKSKKRKKGDDFRLVFILNLSTIGELKIDTRISKKTIGITLEVEKKPIINMIEKLLPELEERLKRKGYQEVTAVCRIMNDESTRESWGEEPFLSKFRMIDLLV